MIHSKSISELTEGMGFEKPTHPLITVIDVSQLAYGEEYVGMKFSSDLYCIGMKDASCGIDYGRNHYDFDEGVLMFTAPKQVITVTKAQEMNQVEGWMLYFHPDLIRNTPLSQRIEEYSFFGYDVHEALHLSDQEQETITQCVEMIKSEIEQRIDDHSQKVLVSGIELLLNHCSRYYNRQFNTRSAQNSDVISKVESLLRNFYRENDTSKLGQPTINYLAEHCHLSSGYLSDLLSKETGRSAKDHINDFMVDKAKNLLLSSDDSISGIAYSLGFNYPHYFGRLFKQKTGMTPQEYRNN